MALADPSDQQRIEKRRLELQAVLDSATAPGLVVKALTGVGLTATDLAVATGANRDTVTSWLDKAGLAIEEERHRERLRELKQVTRLIVSNGAIAEQEAEWLRDPNRAVNFSTPLELIGEGGWREAARIYCDDVIAEVPRVFRAADH